MACNITVATNQNKSWLIKDAYFDKLLNRNNAWQIINEWIQSLQCFSYNIHYFPWYPKACVETSYYHPQVS